MRGASEESIGISSVESVWAQQVLRSRLLDGRVVGASGLHYSLALADEAVLRMAVVGKGGVWMSWFPRHTAVVRWLRHSLTLAGDAISLFAVVCKGGTRMSTSPRHAAMRLELMGMCLW